MAEETITAQTPEIDPGMSVMPEGPGLMDVPTVIPELGLAAQALASQVSFAKKTWKDGSGGGTPVTAVELNRLEQGVADLTAAVNALRDSVSHVIDVPSSYASGDLNKYTTEGRYSITQDSTLSNFPEGAYSFGNLIVMKSYDCVTQLYTPHLTGQGGEQRFLYVRVYFGANWGKWYKAQLQ